jgi:NADPH-dependent ferric siderophore reductase/DNA-binding PadR family transcriptional regulator
MRQHDHHRTGRGKRHGAGKRGPLGYGDLRLFLLALLRDGPSHGYELIRQIEARSNGRYIPSPGVVYPNLGWLEDMGFITPESTGARKAFRITPEGTAFLTANQTTITAILSRDWEDHAPAADAIEAGLDQVKAALNAILRLGEPEPDIAGRIGALLQSTARTLRRHAAPSSSDHNKGPAAMTEIITRHRFDIRRRQLTVKDRIQLSPQMVRFVLGSDDLADFQSLAPDDHIKLFFETGAEKPEMRDYTPRAFDRDARTLTLDFAIHEAGPATQWAIEAKIGDGLTIAGPRGSGVIAPVFDWWLLIGDETALPAMGRWVEEMPAGTRVMTLGLVTDAAEQQDFATLADHRPEWLHRQDPADPAPVVAAAATLNLPEGRGFIWIAAEAGVARALRDHFQRERGHPKEWMKAAGYWLKGQADAQAKSLD